MKTQDTVVKKSRFQIDQLEDRIAPTTALVTFAGTASATESPMAATSVNATGTTTTSFSSTTSSLNSTVSSSSPMVA